LLFRDRTPDFFVQAYFVGPKNVNPHDASTLWLKYEETLSKYEEERKRYNFSILSFSQDSTHWYF
jgi:glycosylphosphatidylinositol transamidase (GPIT) subunit GPI8